MSLCSDLYDDIEDDDLQTLRVFVNDWYATASTAYRLGRGDLSAWDLLEDFEDLLIEVKGEIAYRQARAAVARVVAESFDINEGLVGERRAA